jgi:hypothetical protein
MTEAVSGATSCKKYQQDRRTIHEHRSSEGLPQRYQTIEL